MTITHSAFSLPQGPQRIVCLTEETTEWLYLLGQEHRIVGISGYTVSARSPAPKLTRSWRCSPTACWVFPTCRPTLPAV